MKSITPKIEPETWRAAVLAALPHVLYALMIYGPTVAYDVRTYGLDEIVAPLRHSLRPDFAYPTQLPYLFWTVVVGLSVVGLGRKVPRWSASWIGYGLHGLFGWIVNRDPNLTLLQAGLCLSWVGLMFGGLYWLSQRDPLAALLLILPLAPMGIWLFQMETLVTDLEGLVYLPASLVLSIVVAFMVRRGNLRWGLWGVSGVMLVTGLFISAGVNYYPFYTFSNYPNPANPLLVVSGVVGDFIALGVVGAPLWLWLVWRRWIDGRLPSPRMHS